MFAQHLPGGSHQGVSRPFVVGLILLLLFLSLHTDWSPNNARRGELKQASSQQQIREGVKEKILLELSVVNDKLETENKRLKQYVLDLRRVLRGCGCEPNNSSLAGQHRLVFPELHDLPDEQYQEQQQGGASGGGEAGGSIAGEQQQQQAGGGGGDSRQQPDPIPLHARNTSR